MGKQNGKVISKPSSYILRTWYIESDNDAEIRNEEKKTFDSLDKLKENVKNDIFAERLAVLHGYEYADNGMFSIVDTDDDGSIVHSGGENGFPDFSNRYYKVEDENGKTVSVDWSDLEEFFDMDKPNSGTGYFVCDYYTENDGPLGIVIGKYNDWALPDSVADSSPYPHSECELTIHKTLDECFDYIKESYSKAGEGWYEGMLREHTTTDLSLGPVDSKYAVDRIKKDGGIVNDDRNKAAEAVSSGIQADADSQMSNECDDTN